MFSSLGIVEKVCDGMLNSGTVWVLSEWQRSKLEWYRTVWELKVEMVQNQGSALSPLLFAMVMDRLTNKVRQNSPRCRLSRTSRGEGLPWRGDVWRLAKVRQDMTSEWKGPKWNGEVTGIRGKKSGGFEVLRVNSLKQRRKRGEGVCKHVGMGGEKCRLSGWMKNKRGCSRWWWCRGRSTEKTGGRAGGGRDGDVEILWEKQGWIGSRMTAHVRCFGD